MPLSSIIFSLIAGFILTSGLAFAILSLFEGEYRAAVISTLAALVIGSLLISATLLEHNTERIILGILLVILLVGLVLFFLPIGKVKVEVRDPSSRIDEREIIFARARLEPGSENYMQYYQAHPDHRKVDEAARNQPGLLAPDALYTDPFHSASASASFTLTEALREAVDGTPSADPVPGTPDDHTQMVKKLARYYGALSCGIATLKPGHIYSHIGRGSGIYGDPVDLNHPYGIAFTVEMDQRMVRAAPYPPITMESGKQYVELARVAVQLAAAIRKLGYQARAHIDGNYRVIAPLVARDAGLGEIGRMGLLMTPRLGPRVRLGVVSTDLPLTPDVYQPDESTLDFCRICKKCARNCPSQSIPYDDRQIDNGVLRWKINPESCYHYWTIVGTDCGKCMAICPYSHPDNWAHNLVRWGVRRSGAFRRAALFLDDMLYGKKPPSAERVFLS